MTQAEVQRRLGTQMAGHYFGRSQWEFPTQEMYEKMQEFMPLETDYNEIVGLYRLRQSLQGLQRLQRLQSLQRLENYKKLITTQKYYTELVIPDGAIVYADPPYKGTDIKGYICRFDYEQFERWLDAVPFMVIVSEYTAPSGCVEIASIKKQCLRSPTNTGGTTTEKLFVQERFLKQYNEMREQQRIEI